tara:strand:+ start:361 stop:513 length:153 start_codon:yes stop_codon:yes gene_type:complete
MSEPKNEHIVLLQIAMLKLHPKQLPYLKNTRIELIHKIIRGLQTYFGSAF